MIGPASPVDGHNQIQLVTEIGAVRTLAPEWRAFAE
jgi:hypothetical protein